MSVKTEAPARKRRRQRHTESPEGSDVDAALARSFRLGLLPRYGLSVALPVMRGRCGAAGAA